MSQIDAADPVLRITPREDQERVERSGASSMSDSSMRTNPSIDEPSNMMSPASAFSNCDAGISTFLLMPRMSVNCRRMKRTLSSRASSRMSFLVAPAVSPTSVRPRRSVGLGSLTLIAWHGAELIGRSAGVKGFVLQLHSRRAIWLIGSDAYRLARMHCCTSSIPDVKATSSSAIAAGHIACRRRKRRAMQIRIRSIRRWGMKVQDVMTKDPSCVTPSASIREAAQLMQREDVGIVPVVDEQGNASASSAS